MRLGRHRDLELVAIAAVLCALLAVAVPVEAISILAAAPLVLLLPGYAITAAAFGPRQLPAPQLIALSIGNSLAALVLGSLFLNHRARRRPRKGLVGAPAGAAGARRLRGGGEAARRLDSGSAAAAAAALLRGSTGCWRSAPSSPWPPRCCWPGRSCPPSTRSATRSSRMLPTGNEQHPGVRIGVVSEEQDPTSYEVGLLESTRSRSVVLSGLVLKPGDSRVVNVPIVRSKAIPPGTKLSAYLYRVGSAPRADPPGHRVRPCRLPRSREPRGRGDRGRCVVITNYNYCAFLGEAIESALRPDAPAAPRDRRRRRALLIGSGASGCGPSTAGST